MANLSGDIELFRCIPACTDAEHITGRLGELVALIAHIARNFVDFGAENASTCLDRQIRQKLIVEPHFKTIGMSLFGIDRIGLRHTGRDDDRNVVLGILEVHVEQIACQCQLVIEQIGAREQLVVPQRLILKRLPLP